MLTGVLPFNGPGFTALKENIQAINLSKDQPQKREKIHNVKILEAIFVKEKDRIKPGEALKHPWIQNSNIDSIKSHYSISPSVIKNLINFTRTALLKRVVLGYIANHATEKELELSRRSFIAFDEDFDGRLSKDEIKAGFKEPTEKKSAGEIFEKTDTDLSGFIDYKGIILTIQI